MKKLILILTILLLFFYNNNAGERVVGAKISLLQSENKEVWAMIHTGEKGEFAFYYIPPGSYVLAINIPFTSFISDQKEKEKMDKLVDGGCDKEKGRMVFKLNDNGFIFDINCEDQSNNKFTPHFTITKQENNYLITIAIAEISKPFDLKGLFQSLTAQYYEKCLESGKFKLLDEMSND
jgi:hypothetical protein